MKLHLTKSLAILVLSLIIACTFNIQVGGASKTLVVPDNYATITSAVDHAVQGDVIIVKQGVYYENILIAKSITLEGENNKNTIIIGNGGINQPAVLTFASNSIKVSGFTIKSAQSSTSTQNAFGINIQGDNCTITGNIIDNNYIGIFCALQSSTKITNNIITSSIKDGIRFYSGSLNNVSNNTIISNAVSGIALGGYSNIVEGNNLQNNTRGLGLGASNSVVYHNNIALNKESGIFLSGSKNIIAANEIAANKYGIYITAQLAAPRANGIYHNNFLSNTNNAYGSSAYLVENWDKGYPSGGNFWGDYQSKNPNAIENGSSGIANTPYIINSANIDKFPLINPFNTANPDNLPSAIPPIAIAPNGVVASWTFDDINLDGVISDSTGNNPAILGSTVGNRSFIPEKVAGKIGQALGFNGEAYAFVPPSASLKTSQEVTIDAWVNIQEIKNVSYNNIIVECVRTTLPLPTRTLGLAINGETPQNSSSPPIAAIRGYVMTQNGVLNEIDTKEPVPLNQWLHVVFTRSLTDGMHIYIDGKEQAVMVSSGVVNPTGSIEAQNELYIGHDSVTQIDELQISGKVGAQAQPLWMQWWFLGTLIVGVAICIAVFFKRQNR